ncbi:MAG TPA: peptidylprolyl isomerase [Paracoccus sp. (in: a-proteobacteria)]|uniref:peptidylprolyl isomerase n=1 Tax=Paracoccus sp. TaxID=267 RepID=UPI002CB74D35|nr:peptidylprolyl isomerase [Paracoccus sp. (in: a-proteobacteria)]HWL58548.1 peptidylprolyl isomerase [Paracoccus sp. (in: a-proteobacteria)]
MSAALFPDLVVNGEAVPHAVVASEAQNHSAPQGKPGIAWRKAANAVAMRTLLLQEARRRGMQAEPAEVGPGRFETEEEALIRGLLDATVEVAPPGEEEIRAEWARDPERFRAPPLWEVSHILCACDPRTSDQREAARQRACELSARAAEHPAGFAKLASSNSDCGSRASGGSLGQIGPGDTVPEFEAALRGMSEGEITAEPVLSRHGWHVIRMDAIAEGAVLPFDAVRPRIAEAMEKAAWARGAREFVAHLVASARISGAELGSPADGEGL